jgi:hypothetical protein
MRAELRYLHSPDVLDLENNKPEDPANFCILVQAMIGPRGSIGEESFDFLVCTPRWLEDKVGKSSYVFGRHYLILGSYDYGVLRSAVEELCNRFVEPDWHSIAEKLGRYGKWEFEDYRGQNS